MTVEMLNVGLHAIDGQLNIV